MRKKNIADPFPPKTHANKSKINPKEKRFGIDFPTEKVYNHYKI